MCICGFLFELIYVELRIMLCFNVIISSCSVSVNGVILGVVEMN